MWQQWINALAGVWLIISSFVTSLRTPSNILITGIVVLILAVWGALSRR